ncbi:MAG TPA: serine/threonine-protein kinase [Kofleriaceae bacterium]|nr:serine/threonine-protein kinase [Kofleriaceae bacterium]
MAQCPKCKVSYPEAVRRCPADGTLLGVSAATAKTVSATDREGWRTAAALAQHETTPAPVPEEALPAADPGLLPGDKVGEYQVTGTLGAGGMGTVYQGVHPLIGKKVAIKVLNAGLSQDGSMVQRFVQEARSVNQIGHRNIVDIFAFGQLPSGRHYFIMEYLPGKSLRTRLAEGPLAYAEAFSVIGDVCEALAAAHAEGIVHRDLKPDNIHLVEAKSGERTVKLLDFGIAKLLKHDDTVAAQHQTRSGVPMGTPLFMSPEQCLGKPVDARTDIYSLGVIMFEMFTGQLPFAGASYIETVNGHLSQPPPKPTELADIPDALERVILHCLQKDAAARPQTVTALRAALAEVATGMGAEVRRLTTAPVGAVRAPMRPLVVYTGIALAAGALVIGATLFLRGKPGPVTPAAAGPIALQVVSEPPGAVVTLDGKAQTLRTPTVFHIPRKSSVVVKIDKDDFAPHVESVAIGAGEQEKAITVVLTPRKVPGGQLQVRGPAQVKRATWTLDGKPAGEGAVLSVNDLPPGRHTLKVEAKGYEPREETLDIQSRQLASFEWSLTPQKRSGRPTAARGGKPAAPPHTPTKPAAPVEEEGASWPPK